MQNQAIRQMVQFNKAAFDNGYSLMLTVRDQMEKIISMYMEQAVGLPAESKKALNEWIELYKKGCEDFQQTVNEGFKKLDNIISQKK